MDKVCKIEDSRSCTKSNMEKCQNGRLFYCCALLNQKDKARYDLAKVRAIEYDFEHDWIYPSESLYFETPESFSKDRGEVCKGKAELNDNDEPFIFRAYYRNQTGYCQRCEKKDCSYRVGLSEESKYEIADYQIPPFKKDEKGKKISGRKVDVVLRAKGNKNLIFLAEGKPPKNNDERLLRMVCEILSYYYPLVDKRCFFTKYLKDRLGADNPQIRPAIVFFNESAQEKEFSALKNNPTIDRELYQLIEKYHIAVFRIDGWKRKQNINIVLEKQF